MEPFSLTTNPHRLPLASWEKEYPSLRAGFTLRTGGVSQAPFASFNMGLHVGDEPEDVIANRRALCDEVGVPFAAFTCADQVHGNLVQRVTAEHRGNGRESLQDVIAGVDGLYTDEPDVLLASFYADCVPLYFLDPKRRAIGLAHAGWKGTVSLISKEMVDAFAASFGTLPEEIRVAIGPAIGGCCYEVDERIIDRVKQAASAWEACVTPVSEGKYKLDLGKLNQSILLENGVRPDHIQRTGWCTGCRTDLFFSHRMEAGKTGRMASYIVWRGREIEAR